MASGVLTAAPPVELWERVRDRLRLGGRWRRVGVWLTWGALLLVVALALVQPDYRPGLRVYLCCVWILILWFAVSRTRTVTWGGVSRMFGVGVSWAWLIAATSALLARAAGLAVSDVGPGTAIAAFTEESLKLAPLAVLAIVAPGRVRRFAAVDWLLLGLAAGLGFQAWEDLMRRTYAAITPPGLFDVLLGDQILGAPVYGWGLLSGGSSAREFPSTDIIGYAGHHVFTGLVAGSVGLAVAFWRPNSAPWRIFALILPVLVWGLCVLDHFGYNASVHDPTWYSSSNASAPWLFRFLWPVLGKGTGMGWLLLLVLLAVLLVDGRRFARAGERTDLDLPGWLGRPRWVAERWTGQLRHRLTGSSAWLVIPASAAAHVAVLAARDLTVLAGAHVLEEGEPRRRGLLRARAAGAMLRELRADAIASQVPGFIETSGTSSLSYATVATRADWAPDLPGLRGAPPGGPTPGTAPPGPVLPSPISPGSLSSGTPPLRAATPDAAVPGTDPLRAAPPDTAPPRAAPPDTQMLSPTAERSARRRIRLLALLVLALLILAGTVLAVVVAQQVRTDLSPGSPGGLGWLAGQFDALAQWWSGLGPGEKVLAGAGVAALVGLSGGSLGLALGSAGVFTYAAEHGRGAADFTRDPIGATCSWASTTPPGEAALDAAEFGLTFLPTNFLGAAAGRGVRSVAREYADDPAAFWARRRLVPGEDRGAVDLSVFYGTGGPKITSEGLEHSFSKHSPEFYGTKEAAKSPARRTEWDALVKRTTRSRQVFPWNSRGTATYAHLYRMGDGRWFAVQFSRKDHELVTAFIPHPGQLRAMLRELGR